MTQADRALHSYIISSRSRFEHMLAQLVEVPSISSDPAHHQDLRHTATLAAEYLRAWGAEACLVETKGAPVVSGGWTISHRYPTVTIYNHLDVQPADEPEWRHPPFSFRKDGLRYIGRGTTDDKGPAMTALFAAKFAVDEGVPLNIRFVWELEEEIGSPHFSDALSIRRHVPKPDSVLVSDTIWVSRDRPAISCGLRGLLAVNLWLRTGETDVHSGLTGGGARNPLTELCAIAAACVDARTGRVKIPGFYDAVVPPTSREMRNFLASGFQVQRFQRAFKLRSLRTRNRAKLLTRIWTDPTFEVHGLVGGYTGPGVKTIVPAWGQLKASMRLVPDQHPRHILRLLRQFIARINPDVRIEPQGALEPFRGLVDGPFIDALRRAARMGFGKPPVLIREGGSIGAIPVMHRAWKVPIVFMGLSLPEHGYHAPNEYFDWGQVSGGIRTFVHYFRELATINDD
ncbi:MAG: M20/M25/M40 family metallo-hydrolase [Nitrospirae bacterium]|nr:MAG: M20/M25/M40 family metallo-hydrolase [Nitrospirota bacterium]